MLRKLALLIGDISILLIALYFAVLFIYPDELKTGNRFSTYYNMLPLMVVIAGILFNINGLFSLARKKFSEIVIGLAVAEFNLIIIMMAMSFLFNAFSYSRTIFVLAVTLQFILLVLWKYLFWRMERSLVVTKSALLIGDEIECLRVRSRLNLESQLKYQVRYICKDSESDSWESVADKIDMMIVCSKLTLETKAEIVHFCHSTGKQVVLIPDFYELFCAGIEIDKIDDIPVFRPRSLIPTLEQRSLKRMLDIAVAGSALLLLWPLMLVVAILIKLDSPGPAVFSQVRVGRHGREFKVYKFRSMNQGAEQKTGPVLAAQDDPRITNVGIFIRTTRLDELPQLFNVLLGDMSIVGPRPERPFFVEQFKQNIPEYMYRHNVKPGITGLAQVYGKYNTTPYNKLIYDLMYIQKYSVLTDLVIMLQTIRILVTKSSTEGVEQHKKSDVAHYSIDKSA